jgi:hypothetical protein
MDSAGVTDVRDVAYFQWGSCGVTNVDPDPDPSLLYTRGLSYLDPDHFADFKSCAADQDNPVRKRLFNE